MSFAEFSRLVELGLKPSAVTKMSERPSDAGVELVNG
jgi:hypothetical protein